MLRRTCSAPVSSLTRPTEAPKAASILHLMALKMVVVLSKVAVNNPKGLAPCGSECHARHGIASFMMKASACVSRFYFPPLCTAVLHLLISPCLFKFVLHSLLIGLHACSLSLVCPLRSRFVACGFSGLSRLLHALVSLRFSSATILLLDFQLLLCPLFFFVCLFFFNLPASVPCVWVFFCFWSDTPSPDAAN